MPVLVLVFCTSLTKPEVISVRVGVCLYFAMLLESDFLTDFYVNFMLRMSVYMAVIPEKS